jgi:hypothetical protein
LTRYCSTAKLAIYFCNDCKLFPGYMFINQLKFKKNQPIVSITC